MYWSEFAEDMVKTIKLGVSGVTAGALAQDLRSIGNGGYDLDVGGFYRDHKRRCRCTCLGPGRSRRNKLFPIFLGEPIESEQNENARGRIDSHADNKYSEYVKKGDSEKGLLDSSGNSFARVLVVRSDIMVVSVRRSDSPLLPPLSHPQFRTPYRQIEPKQGH